MSIVNWTSEFSAPPFGIQGTVIDSYFQCRTLLSEYVRIFALPGNLSSLKLQHKQYKQYFLHAPQYIFTCLIFLRCWPKFFVAGNGTQYRFCIKNFLKQPILYSRTYSSYISPPLELEKSKMNQKSFRIF